MVSLFTIVSVALTLTTSGVFGQCPPNLTGIATSGVNIQSFDFEGSLWGSETTPVVAGLAVTGQSSRGFSPTFIITPDPVITTTFTISDITNTSLLVTNIGNQLFYEPASTTGTTPACLTCATPEGQAIPGGSFCSVVAHGTDNCVQNEDSADPLPVTPCGTTSTSPLVDINPGDENGFGRRGD
ncbi:hypothetical protein BT96DRAFT_409745 [Gymnopus androsaceus JB14]|uniref:Uncharacterized protein n=1 Tax=Gymnopus androsaceus JB14 TaxID=1447944 RepID=A0A6A4HYT3_9AGAR|nr:hypothetical protein BT96DRAFT_409745 [Gymnopus androsaceus JB14]